MKRILYWVNTKELNRKLCIELSILYTKTGSLYYYYNWSTLNDYISILRLTYVKYTI